MAHRRRKRAAKGPAFGLKSDGMTGSLSARRLAEELKLLTFRLATVQDELAKLTEFANRTRIGTIYPIALKAKLAVLDNERKMLVEQIEQLEQCERIKRSKLQAEILPVVEQENTQYPKSVPGVWGRFRLHLDGLDRYHSAGALVMTVGSAGMFLASALALGPLWAGFLAGALPTFLMAALVHPEHA
jgi:hypothetical protein